MSNEFRLRDGWFPAGMVDAFDDDLDSLEWNVAETHFRVRPQTSMDNDEQQVATDTYTPPDLHSASDPDCACPECTLALEEYAESSHGDRHVALYQGKLTQNANAELG